jgi:hypothetical protein
LTWLEEGEETLKQSVDYFKALIIHRMIIYLKEETLQEAETRNPMLLDLAMSNVISGVVVILSPSYLFFRWNH